MVQSTDTQPRYRPFVLGLIVAVSALALVHALGAALATGNLLFHGGHRMQQPFSTEFATPVVRDPTNTAERAGLMRGDIVLSINGRPFSDMRQLRDETRIARPHGRYRIVFIRPVVTMPQWQAAAANGQLARTIDVPATEQPPLTPGSISLDLFFFFVPLLCLLTGLYVLLAKPFSLQAWCVFVVLAFPDCAFMGVILMPAAFLAPALFWNHLIQALLPIAVLLFGVTFPERSTLDRHAPWLKWLLLVPLLVLIPYDLCATYVYWYNFRLFPVLIANFLLQARIGNAFSFLCAVYFIVSLVFRYRGSTGDVRRRLRILYVGATVGLGGFFAFVITSVLFRASLGTLLPEWMFVLLLVTLLLFPLSLAYVVVVQRAMELRILIRQGTKYFFARQSVFIVRVAFTFWVVWALTKYSLHPERRRAADLVFVGAVLAMFVLYRVLLAGKLQQWIDRRFFRDAYSSEQVLSELSDQARNFTEVRPLLTTVIERIGATLHIDQIGVFLRSGDHYELQFATGASSMLDDTAPLTLAASSLTVNTLIREGGPAVAYRDDPTSWLVKAPDNERAALRDLAAELLVPLTGRNQLLGILTLGPKRSEEPYSRTDRQLLQSVASQTGLALENAELLANLTTEIAHRERISSEIAIARDVQQRLFPQKYPNIAGLDMAGSCRPAQAVGGDYYDLFATGSVGSSGRGSRLGLAVGDISGKGISASLLMASLRAGLRILASMDEPSGERELTRLIRQVNRLVYDSSDTNRYATFFFAELDPETRLLTYVNAGHNPPVVLRGAEAIALQATGLVVGLLEDASYEQGTMQLQSGDVLLAYTDGISEAMNAAEEEWGEEAMLRAAKSLIEKADCAWSAQSLVKCLFHDADCFTAGAPQHDDMTVVVCVIH